MVCAELLGRHTHVTANGIAVLIYRRGNSFLARGSYARQRFGETLGANEQEAEAQLHSVLHDIGQGTYIPASERNKRQLGWPSVGRLTVKQLVDEFLTTKRSTVGQATTADYRNRLAPLVEFSEIEGTRRRWPMAADVNRDFAMQFRNWLTQRMVHRNGRAASEGKRISPNQMYNVLDCCRTMFNWAKSIQVAKLPSTYINPFDRDVVGQRPAKDPLRKQLYPIEFRTQLVSAMDEWQLTHLAIPMLLPLRPEDYTGLLISEVDFGNNWFEFGSRFHGRDFNKGHVSYVCPFPASLSPILQFLIGGRRDGPLLRARSIFERQRRPRRTIDAERSAEWHIDDAFCSATPQDLSTPQDQKRLVRRIIREMGGADGDKLASEFEKLCLIVAGKKVGRFYDLRGSINTDLDRAEVSHLVQRYVTGHSTRDILNEYVTLDPCAEMQKYFVMIEPLTTAILARAEQLRLRLPGE